MGIERTPYFLCRRRKELPLNRHKLHQSVRKSRFGVEGTFRARRCSYRRNVDKRSALRLIHPE
jgi:hypothetical protein